MEPFLKSSGKLYRSESAQPLRELWQVGFLMG